MGYSPEGCKESDMTEATEHDLTIFRLSQVCEAVNMPRAIYFIASLLQLWRSGYSHIYIELFAIAYLKL